MEPVSEQGDAYVMQGSVGYEHIGDEGAYSEALDPDGDPNDYGGDDEDESAE